MNNYYYNFQDSESEHEDLGSLIGSVIIKENERVYLEKLLVNVEIKSTENREIECSIFDSIFICGIIFNDSSVKKYVITKKGSICLDP